MAETTGRNRITRPVLCPICGSFQTGTFLFLEQVPVHQNLVISEQAAAINTARGDLQLAVCKRCGFIFNRAFDPAKLMYGADYDNAQTHSPFFQRYLDELADHLIYDKGVQKCRILEVGCGNGVFLRKLVEPAGAGNSGIGFDPSYDGPEIDLNGLLRFEKRYYGPGCADLQADVIICRHVIEHVAKPPVLLKSIRQSLGRSSHARGFFETPCVEWILRHNAFWDLFYEHCSYFSTKSLTTAFEQAGFTVNSFKHVFEGQYLLFDVTADTRKWHVKKDPADIPRQAYSFGERMSAHLKSWRDKVKELAERAGVVLWGAGAKGATFANLIDPERKQIAAVVDINPQKQGCYIPGTGHQIVGCQALAGLQAKCAVLMNDNYLDECRALLQKEELQVELVGLTELLSGLYSLVM